MTEIDLAYGKEFVPFKFDERRFRILTRSTQQLAPLSDAKIGEALAAPINSPALDGLFSSGDSILIVVSDATRATASAQVVHLLVRRLIQVGVSPADIAIIFATGIHRPVTAEEKSELVTPFITQRIKLLDHNAYDSSAIVTLGSTARGTPIEVNRALKEFRHVIVTGGVGFHYFAGFTGGRKSICPGLASARTIEATHMWALDFETGGRREGVETGLLAGNAVHEECEQIAAMVSPSFGVNSVVDERGRAVRVYAGDWRAAHYHACQEYLVEHSVTIEKRRELVIVSCGGLPYDINLIQAHKALDMAVRACTDAGTIVLLAECRDGLGRPDFLKWFDEADARDLAMRLRNGYEVNGQTAWSLLTKAERFRVHLVSELLEDDVSCMRLIPARSLQAVMDTIGNEVEGYIMPNGASVLPKVSRSA